MNLSQELVSPRSTRGKKRKRNDDHNSTDGGEDNLETTSEDEKLRINAEECTPKKVIKKLATNDHVLPLVKLKEDSLKLTRSKVKELMKVSPNSTPWNIENLELTPIKHIPVKTRPEVKALIAQELPEDEDDEEYEPTHDDAPSDDDQTLESCSDLDSQPRTPATPKRLPGSSPRVVKDGPFKVPQELNAAARRKLELEEEEATIALRTRSKLSLSSTSIEHIESSFVPPDDLPVPDVDDLWNEFLEECLNPAPTAKNEDDDEADPEYNVAADPDAHDEDEALENSIVKISKKEINDLFTELFNVMPANEELVDNLVQNVESEKETPPTNCTDNILSATHWEGKQEPISDEERQQCNIIIESRDSRISVGKSEPPDIENRENAETANEVPDASTEQNNCETVQTTATVSNSQPLNVVTVSVQVEEMSVAPGPAAEGEAVAPPLLRRALTKRTNTLEIQLVDSLKILPEQISILQQQLRQHIQLATSNFLQLYVHPVHWNLAPMFKEYLHSLQKLTIINSKSVVNVCNLTPACELISTWEKTVSENTPENNAMVEFIQAELERSRRRIAQNSLYVGEFHEKLKNVIANSPVFLYPYLLPPMPYRPDNSRRFSYLRSEDELIALGLSEFWQYVEDNPELYKRPSRPHPRHRWGLRTTCTLLCKYMFPWISPCTLIGHIRHVKQSRDLENPIMKFFVTQKIIPVQHKLLPFNPKMTLYEQPEHEIPRIWVRHLSKTSKRFRDYLYRRTKYTGMPPQMGVTVDLGKIAIAPEKKPLSSDFIKEIPRTRHETDESTNKTPTDQTEINRNASASQYLVPTNIFSMVQTSTGTVLVPLTIKEPNTATTNGTPVSTTEKIPVKIPSPPNEQPKKQRSGLESGHCQCCGLLRKICKLRQTTITDYFKQNNSNNKACPCKGVRYPKITKNLKLLVNNYKNYMMCKLREVETTLNTIKNKGGCDDRLDEIECNDGSQGDLEFVTTFLIKLNMRTSIARNNYMKKKVYNILSKFEPDSDSPVQLANQLFSAFDVDLVDIHKEFMAFLTPEQADKVGKFKDHFMMICITKLIKKIEEEVLDQSKQKSMLLQLNAVLVDNMMSACEICSSLLDTMHGYPRLATYVFNLFPHRHKRKLDVNKEHISESASNTTTQEEVNNTTTAELCIETKEENEMKSPVNSEDDDSSNDEEGSETEDLNEREPMDTKSDIALLNENTSSNYVLDTRELTISKTEVQESLNSSHSSPEMAMTIVSEDEEVKTEAPEWSRDEDKLILQVLKQFLTPKERNDKTILQIIEEKQIFQMISDGLLHKSTQDIKDRILYLLEILAQSER